MVIIKVLIFLSYVSLHYLAHSAQVSYLLGLAFDLDAHIRFTLLILGCCPGGGPSNFVTLIVHGDIHLSVIMTCVSNLVSIGQLVCCLYVG